MLRYATTIICAAFPSCSALLQCLAVPLGEAELCPLVHLDLGGTNYLGDGGCVAVMSRLAPALRRLDGGEWDAWDAKLNRLHHPLSLLDEPALDVADLNDETPAHTRALALVVHRARLVTDMLPAIQGGGAGGRAARHMPGGGARPNRTLLRLNLPDDEAGQVVYSSMDCRFFKHEDHKLVLSIPRVVAYDPMPFRRRLAFISVMMAPSPPPATSGRGEDDAAAAEAQSTAAVRSSATEDKEQRPYGWQFLQRIPTDLIQEIFGYLVVPRVRRIGTG